MKASVARRHELSGNAVGRIDAIVGADSIATNAFSSLQFSEIDGDIFDQYWGNVVATIPEPGTWLMMAAGFGLIGGTMRRRVSGRSSLSSAPQMPTRLQHFRGSYR